MRAWLLVVVAGCRFHTHAAGDGGLDARPDGAADTAIDQMPDAFDPMCFGHGAFYFCLTALPTAPLAFPGDKNFVSTPDTATTCDGGDGQVLMITGVPACVVSATTITTSNPTGSYGSLPLVLVATDAITIGGLFDGRSAIGGQPGPGSNPGQCGAQATANGGDNLAGGGGGAGASSSTLGGGGGSGAAASAAAGVPIATRPGDVLRGGCDGGAGGMGTSGRAPGGAGGGAVYLVARNAITISGTLTACGGGGTGGTGLGGGGGGGAGGMLILDAPTLTIDPASAIVANGGGGGGGASTTSAGGNGGDATALASPAGGGAADVTAGAGGAGAYGQTAAGPGGPGTSGGGGGGGAVGVIHVVSTQTIPATQVSPPPS